MVKFTKFRKLLYIKYGFYGRERVMFFVSFCLKIPSERGKAIVNFLCASSWVGLVNPLASPSLYGPAFIENQFEHAIFFMGSNTKYAHTIDKWTVKITTSTLA